MRSRVLAAAFATLLIGTAAARADVAAVATTNTRLHTGPGSREPIIRRVPQGARLDVTSCADRWCLAEWRGVQGYISQNLMDFPNGSAAVDQGTSDDEGTTVVRRTYVEPQYVVPDDDQDYSDYPDYPDYSDGPYYGAGVFVGPGYYGGRYHHWRGGHQWHHWGPGTTPQAGMPRPPGWGQRTGAPGPYVRPQNPNPVVGGRPNFGQPGPASRVGAPRPGGPVWQHH